MQAIIFIGCVSLLCSATAGMARGQFESDVIRTQAGELKMTFIGHATLMFTFNNLTLHTDPWSRFADYAALPQADIILITHEHADHLDPDAVKTITKEGTVCIGTIQCARQLKSCDALKNGEVRTVKGIRIEAIAAYNIEHKRETGLPFHPKGEGNGYLLTFGEKRIYVAGDTENTPEMKALKNIDVAFLPMNLPYTMTPEMVADAARAFRPKIIYPYHYGDTEPTRLAALLKTEKAIEVRIRKLK